MPVASHYALATPRSILVIKPSSLGDVVHTLPAVACVKHHWPQARISWLVNPEWAPLLQGNPYLADVIEFPRKRFAGWMGWTKFPGWMRALKDRAKPDVALDFQGLLRSAMIGRWTGAEVWGTSDSREGARFLHQHRVEVPPRSAPVHAVTRTLALVKALGCPVPDRLEWPLPSGSPPRIMPPSRYVLLHPFSRGRGKSLSVEEVSAICQALAPTAVVIAGRCDLHMPGMANVTNLLNATTLPELCWLIANAAFTVSVDSGPMHIAAALTDRLLAIHTWSDPRQVGPYQPKAWVWKDGRVGRMEAFPEGESCERTELPAWIAERALAGE